jgi:hypothetical protein
VSVGGFSLGRTFISDARRFLTADFTDYTDSEGSLRRGHGVGDAGGMSPR